MKAELNLKFISITNNMKNCFRIGTFTEKSITNFKKNNEAAYDLMIIKIFI